MSEKPVIDLATIQRHLAAFRRILIRYAEQQLDTDDDDQMLVGLKIQDVGTKLIGVCNLIREIQQGTHNGRHPAKMARSAARIAAMESRETVAEFLDAHGFDVGHFLAESERRLDEFFESLAPIDADAIELIPSLVANFEASCEKLEALIDDQAEPKKIAQAAKHIPPLARRAIKTALLGVELVDRDMLFAGMSLAIAGAASEMIAEHVADGHECSRLLIELQLAIDPESIDPDEAERLRELDEMIVASECNRRRFAIPADATSD